jgi:hypothetical protein
LGMAASEPSRSAFPANIRSGSFVVPSHNTQHTEHTAHRTWPSASAVRFVLGHRHLLATTATTTTTNSNCTTAKPCAPHSPIVVNRVQSSFLICFTRQTLTPTPTPTSTSDPRKDKRTQLQGFPPNKCTTTEQSRTEDRHTPYRNLCCSARTFLISRTKNKKPILFRSQIQCAPVSEVFVFALAQTYLLCVCVCVSTEGLNDDE